jgi:hypothetical protein
MHAAPSPGSRRAGIIGAEENQRPNVCHAGSTVKGYADAANGALVVDVANLN